MTDDTRDDGAQTGEPVSGEQQPLQAGRRRFLKKGSAVGAGVAVYTVHHSRSFAGDSSGTEKELAPGQLAVSSQAACESLGGTVAGTVTVVDSMTGQQVERLACDVPTTLNPFQGRLSGGGSPGGRWSGGGSPGGGSPGGGSPGGGSPGGGSPGGGQSWLQDLLSRLFGR